MPHLRDSVATRAKVEVTLRPLAAIHPARKAGCVIAGLAERVPGLSP
jgi:hypothetical protein